MKKKNMILVTNQKCAEQLADEGFKYMLQHLENNTVGYVFLETERLRKILSDKSRFSKKDWNPMSRLCF